MIHQIFDWVSPSVTQHVALALMHSLWQGVLVAFVLAAVLRLFRDRVPADKRDVAGRSPTPANTRVNVRYTIACFGLLVIAALPVVNLLVIETATDRAISLDSASEQTRDDSLQASGQRDPVAAADSLPAQSTIAIEGPIHEPVSGEMEPTIVASAHGDLLGAEPDRGAAAPASLVPWVRQVALQSFFWTWLFGVALLSAWHVAGWALSRELRRRGVAPTEEILALVERTARRLGIHRAVAVRQTLKATTPMVIGWIKPALILPASILTGLATHELEAVLAHELAHVRRHDYLVNLIQTVVETLMFYHPAVWWVSCRIRSEREFCADDLAMRICDRREVYARSLVAVAEIALASAPHAVAATGGSLLHRVRRILRLPDQRSTSPRFTRPSALTAAMATACLGVVLMAVAQSQPTNDKPLSEGADVTTDANVSTDAENTVESRQDREVPESALQRAADLAPPVRITAGGEPIDVDGSAAPYLADFDEDGTKDLLVGQAGYGRLRIYRNTGTNARPKFDSFEWFTADDRIAAVPIGCNVGFIPQLADFDGDGRTDVLTGSFDGGALYLFRRRDDGTFDAGEVLENKHGEVQLGPLKYNTTVFVHDWDDDGDGDLLLGKGNRCLVPNEGTREQPVFGDATPIMIDGEPIHNGVATPCVADWDGDGRDDLLAGLSRDIVWYRNTGTKGRPLLEGPRILVFGFRVSIGGERPGDTPAHPHAICAADFNGDGRLDLLLGDTYFVKRSLDEKQRADLAEAAEMAYAIRGKCRDLIGERPKNETREERIARFRKALEKWRELETLAWSPGTQGDGPDKERHGHVWLFERIAVESRKQSAITSIEDQDRPTDFTAKEGSGRTIGATEEGGFRIDPTTDTPEWQKMIALSRDLRQIRSGRGQLTLMRVLLEDGDPDALIQLTSAKLLLPEQGTGGGLYRQIRSGDFVLVEHFSSARRKDGKDPVEIGTFTHSRPTIWVGVPPPGKLGILGDVVLSPIPAEKMGRIVATPVSGTAQQIDVRRFCVGPVVVGGLYGETFPFHLNQPSDTGRIAPGTYEILLPDFDMKNSRWTVEVLPGEVTHLRFLARSQQVIEKIEEVRSPETESESRKVRAPTPEAVQEHAEHPSRDVDRLDDGGFALLHRAAIGGDLARVIGLLESGADVNVQQAKYHGTPLQYAATGGHVEVVRVLLDHQAKIDAADTSGRTPLMWAAMEGKTETVRLLLDRHANVNAKTRNAWTPLHYAVDRRRVETAQLLIDRGANIAARSSLSKTPRELRDDLELRWPMSATSSKNDSDAKQPTEPGDKRAEPGDRGAESGQRRETPVAPTGLPDYVSTVLHWLPADSETLIVAKDFTLPDYPRERTNNHVGFADAGQSLAVGPQFESLKEGLANERVRWAVHGGRNFDGVSSFGTVRQEGASVIRFEKELPEEELQDLRSRLRDAAKEVRSLSQHEVYVFPVNRDEMESWVKLKPWQGKYVVFPNGRTLITASSDAYLEQVLDRMKAAPSDRALPAFLPEWKHVDPTAKVWLLRHLPESSERPREKRKLRGLVWMMDTSDGQPLRAVYLPMPGQRVDDIARQPWIMPNEKEIPEELAFLLEFETSPDGTVTFRFARPSDTAPDADRLRELKEQLEKSDARIRLFTLRFYLYSSQGIRH